MLIAPKISTSDVTVGDPIYYQLRIPFDQGVVSLNLDLKDYIEPAPEDNALVVLGQATVPTTNAYIYEGTFALFKPGAYRVKAFKVFDYQVEAVPITVRSVLSETTTPDLRAVKGPYQTWSWGWIPLLLVLVAIGYGLWWWTQRPKHSLPSTQHSAPSTSPYELWKEFETYFNDLDLSTVSDWKIFYFETSQKLKDCFYAVHAINIRDLTTFEIKRTALGVFDPLQHDLLAVLAAADLVKFAKHVPSNEFTKEYTEKIAALIQSLKPA